jgi:predicted metal-dependent phosphoesterase TrpH
VFALDLHAHTRFFHGRERAARWFDPVGFRMLTWAAAARGLDGVALTNHDYYREFDASVAVPDDLAVVPGNEISTSRGHLLVVGPDPPTDTTPGELTPPEAVDLAHDRGCVAIVAHPYRNSTVRETDADFDAIEINGKHQFAWALVEQLAEERGLPMVGGSDAHYPVEAGRAYTLVDAEKPTPEAVADAIRAGRVEPRVFRDPLHRGIAHAYEYLHRRKGQLDSSLAIEEAPSVEEESPRVAVRAARSRLRDPSDRRERESRSERTGSASDP